MVEFYFYGINVLIILNKWGGFWSELWWSMVLQLSSIIFRNLDCKSMLVFICWLWLCFCLALHYQLAQNLQLNWVRWTFQSHWPAKLNHLHIPLSWMLHLPVLCLTMAWSFECSVDICSCKHSWPVLRLASFKIICRIAEVSYGLWENPYLVI